MKLNEVLETIRYNAVVKIVIPNIKRDYACRKEEYLGIAEHALMNFEGREIEVCEIDYEKQRFYIYCKPAELCVTDGNPFNGDKYSVMLSELQLSHLERIQRETFFNCEEIIRMAIDLFIKRYDNE